MYTHLLFDLDGTLVHSRPGIMACYKYTLQQLHKPIPDDEVIQAGIGVGLQRSFVNLLKNDPDLLDEAVKIYRERYFSKERYNASLYEGVHEMLNKLKENGKKLYIATMKNQDATRLVLDYFKISTFFEAVIGVQSIGEEITKSGIITNALKKIHPKELSKIIMVGDTIHDINGAHENNIPVIAVTYGYGKPEEIEEAKPEFACDSAEEVAKVILDSNS